MGSKERLARYHGKVFCIGMYKTGTTSMTAALAELGFNEAWFRSPADPGKLVSTASFALVPGLDQFDYSAIESFVLCSPQWETFREVANIGTSFADGPWLFLFREWDRVYPGSKFILTLRQGSTMSEAAASAAASDLAMWKRLEIYPEIRGRYKDDDILEMMKSRYIHHVSEVRSHFAGRDDSLLEICLAENTDQQNWDQLTTFLGVYPQVSAFPKLSVAPQ